LFLVQNRGRTFFVDSQKQLNRNEEIKTPNTNISPISGLGCENYKQRPIAVMIANDNVARPLSGLTEADMVFEMQVVEDSITRLMAVYVCGSPEEIGSIRSARDDFIPLAMGLDAIYAHWGGSHFALDQLNGKVMENIDALRNPYNAFYRSARIWAPHNGFTSIKRLVNSASNLGYRLENGFEGYKHSTQNSNVVNSERITRSEATGSKTQNLSAKLKISYSKPYDVEYKYDSAKNSYLRFRGGKAEMDKNNGKQVEAKNIVVMRAKSRQIEGQYNDVEVEGEGKISVYQNGEVVEGAWGKDKADKKSKLYFLNNTGKEIEFVPGQIWVEVIEPEKSVTYVTD
jgi:hypothetical protein